MAQIPSTNSRPTSSGNALSPKQSRTSPVLKPAALNTTSPHTSAPTQSAPRKDSSLQPSPSISHRSSFAENLRNYPPSPRAQRTQSFSGQALTDLLMGPTVKSNGEEARFRGRDWRSVQVGEIIDPAEVRFVELETSIEDTTKLLIKSGPPNVVLIRESRKTRTAIGTFGYSELNTYLLLVLGLSQPDELAEELAKRARSGETIPLGDVNDHLGPREQPAFLPHTAELSRAMEVLGGGVHRVVITKEGTSETVGVLSQLRLVRFFWENHQNFTATERLYPMSLKELGLGAQHMVAINGDKPLADALRLMHGEGITSLPVLDNHSNVVGNISHVDVRLLTDTSSIPLLSNTCIHFIGVILSERGMWDGKDSYPVFHVTPLSTLAHTVAKLCATRSHRMWIVEDGPSPSASVPPSPSVHTHPPFGTSPSSHNNNVSTPSPHPAMPPSTATTPSTSIPAAGAHTSGRLSGVVSLTDVLNLFARASGLSPGNPEELRLRRRRGSSSSSSLRGNAEGVRASGEILRGAEKGGRRGSESSGRGGRG
ncbi:cell separation during budding [Friedmanniomyces endolithicus]|uniref:Cell separation during budding n=1 Tax=Friedmanniomyces endolithicus TaxID=329885 RepID=A0AAN6GYN7_9PEZI|nr:cell separation during budding [Friedmanniomyces endolithicus]KAK1002917.1 cell separation during budding [Friedmanniomyces endolithicus]KAK1026774.1 cell separation during budding [Friedmanniomyces endolithicus]